MEHEIARLREAGMDGVVTKPLDPGRLFREIRSVLEVRGVLGPIEDGAEDAAEDHGTDGAFDLLAELEAGDEPVEPRALRTLAAQIDAEFASELVDDFRTAAPDHIEHLARSRADEDAEAVADTAHALKSAAGAIGLRRVWRLAGGVEQSARAGHLSEVDEALAELPGAIETGLAGYRS